MQAKYYFVDARAPPFLQNIKRKQNTGQKVSIPLTQPFVREVMTLILFESAAI